MVILFLANTLYPSGSLAAQNAPDPIVLQSNSEVSVNNITEPVPPEIPLPATSTTDTLNTLPTSETLKPIDMIHIDETRKLVSNKNKRSDSGSEGDVAYIRHVADLPKDYKDRTPAVPRPDKIKSAQESVDDVDSDSEDILSDSEDEETSAEDSETDEEDEYKDEDQSYEVDENSNRNHSNELIAEHATHEEKSSHSAANNEYPIKNKAGYYSVGFKDESGQDLVSFSHGKSKIVMNPEGAETVKGKINANTITYEEIYPNIDIKYTAKDYSLKEEITLRELSEKNEFTFQLDLSNVEFEIMPEGEIKFTDPDTEEPVFYMAKSFAVDIDGNRCDSVKTELSEDGELVLTVDPEWMAQANYPVIIDPTIFLPNAQFPRYSSAYKMDGTMVSAETPRYENGKYGQGIMIEEGTKQLFPDTKSLSFSSAWTSSTLNGTYTVSIRAGTGRLTLSGGATGFVTVGNSLTFSVTDAQVTFTPSGGTPQRCQLEKKDHATQWNKKGTDIIGRWSESLVLPAAGMFNKGNWTVEMVYIREDTRPAGSQQSILWSNGNGYTLGTNQDGYIYGTVTSGGNAYSIVSDVIPALGSTYTIMFAGDGGNLCLCINGEQIDEIGYEEPESPLPTFMYIGASGDASNIYDQCNGIIDDLRISTRARTLDEHQAAFNSNQPLPVDGVTSCKMGFDGNLNITAYSVTSGNGINTMHISTTFARGGPAYESDGTKVEEDKPRFEEGKFGPGIFIEEANTNLLSGPDAGDYIEDFSLNQYNSGTMTLDTSEHLVGPASIKWVGADSVSQRGIRSLAIISVSNGQSITESVYLKGSGTCRIAVAASGTWLAQSATITLTDEWTRYNITYTNSSGSTKSTWFEVVQYSVSSPATIYMDCFQAERRSFMTSWGPSHAAETLTLPYACMTETNWTMEMTFVPKDPQKNVYLWQYKKDTTNYWSLGTNQSGYLYYTICVSGTSHSITSNIAPAVGSSYSIMITNDGVRIRLYVNGTDIGSIAYVTLGTLHYPMYLGSSTTGTNQCDGVIDDLRISNRARTLEEHVAAYESDEPLPIDDSTVVKLNFDNSLGDSNSYTADIHGTGILPYWNYTSASLGGGWSSSVNTYNLNMLLGKSLFNIPGRGVPIQEGITYNSLDERNGPLGIGWHLNSDVSLIETEDANIIYNGGDGSAYTFAHNSDGTYTSPPGIYLTLEKQSAGNFTITDKDQTVYTFANNKLSEIVDENDNTTSFEYNDKGSPSIITDPSGRTLTYSYNPTGQLNSVTAPGTRSYQFTYQDNQLTTVTDPENNVFNLAYDTNGHLSTFTDPMDRITTFNIGDNGQAVYVDDARTNGEDIYRTTFAQPEPTADAITTVTDPLEHVSTYYHDFGTGNLTKLEDAVGDTVRYEWENNNLMSVQNAKGTVSYTYDDRGNILTKTTDSSSGQIKETMTYDGDNQLMTRVDGSNRKYKYQYDIKGDLLSTSNPDVQESNGRKYDQYGNVIEYSPRVSGRHNLLSNGSFERPGTGGNLLANWTHQQAGTASLEGFNSHGNSALKVSCNEPADNLFYQVANEMVMTRAALRADIKLDNVQSPDNNGGAMIQIRGPFTETWYIWGNGTFPLVLSALTCETNPTVYIGLKNATGTVWFDGVQLEASSSDEYCSLSQFNSVENSSFKYDLTNWSYTGQAPTIYQYNSWDYPSSLRMTGNTEVYQDVPTYGGESLTLTGMVRASNDEGHEAYIKVDYYNSANQLIPGASVETGHVTDTDGKGIETPEDPDLEPSSYAMLTALAIAPSEAKYARVILVFDGGGTVLFDSIKLIPRNTTTYTYDPSGNYMISSEDPSGNHNYYSYDEDTGNLLSFTDGVSNTTHYTYDNLNRLLQVQEPLTHQAYYGYDDVSNLTSSRDPRSLNSTDNNYLTSFNQNEINLLSELTDPISKTTTNSYDRVGNLISVLQPNGMEIGYAYNDANYLNQKTIAGGETYINYAYDGAKHLIGVTDQDGNSSWDYDGSGRVQYSIDSLGKRYDYKWDASNNLSRISAGVNNSTYTYGKTNKLISSTTPVGFLRYNYDEKGQVFQIQSGGYGEYGDEYDKFISYYSNGWCSYIQDKGYPDVYPFSYQYYNNGNISSVSSWAGEDSYEYDPNGRLTEWTMTPTNGTPTQESYVYDAAGNMTTKGSQTFSYDAANRIIGYDYDDNGNLISDGTYDYTYEAENKLTEVSSGSSTVATYTYYYNGLRKSKTVDGVTTYFHWDAFGNLASENDTEGNSFDYYYDPSGNLIGFIKDGDLNQKYFYHTNLHGDIVSITDSSNTILAQYTYDPWGTQTSYTGTLSQPLRYAGYYLDTETGMYYLKSRYYSPSMGRFLTKDAHSYVKKKNPQTLNSYSYVLNNPVRNVDSSGHFAVALPLIATGGEEIVVAVLGLLTGALLADSSDSDTDSLDTSEVNEGTVVGPKIRNQMDRRGWTNESINDTIDNPFTTREATNKANGNDATAYYNEDGSYVVRDNQTGEVVQLSNRNIPNWAPDDSIVEPYFP